MTDLLRAKEAVSKLEIADEMLGTALDWLLKIEDHELDRIRDVREIKLMIQYNISDLKRRYP